MFIIDVYTNNIKNILKNDIKKKQNKTIKLAFKIKCNKQAEKGLINKLIN